MFHWIYAQPLWRVIAEMIFGVLLWAVLRCTIGRKKPRIWAILNLCSLTVALFGILYLTVIRRTPGEYELILMPGYFLIEGKIQPEIYRSLLMNVLLYFPFGLSLSAALDGKRRPWRTVLFTCLIGLGVSLAVETAQYLGRWGRAEADDVLANTLGTFLGASHVLIGNRIGKLLDSAREDRKNESGT